MDRPDATEDDLSRRVEELEKENARLRNLLGLDRPDRAAPLQAPRQRLFTEIPSLVDPTVTQDSTSKDKVRLYRSLFRGRNDVYALRWEQTSTGKKGRSPAAKGGWRKGAATAPELLPWTDDETSRHLAGEITAGLYPLTSDDTCFLLACDFDGPGSLLDALAYRRRSEIRGHPSRAGALAVRGWLAHLDLLRRPRRCELGEAHWRTPHPRGDGGTRRT